MGLWDELLATLSRPPEESSGKQAGEQAGQAASQGAVSSAEVQASAEEGEVVLDVVKEIQGLQMALAAEWLHRVELGLETLELWYRRIDEGNLGVPWEQVRAELEKRIIQSVQEGRPVTLPMLYGEVLSDIEAAQSGERSSQGSAETQVSQRVPEAQPPGRSAEPRKPMSPEEAMRERWLREHGFHEVIARMRKEGRK